MRAVTFTLVSLFACFGSVCSCGVPGSIAYCLADVDRHFYLVRECVYVCVRVCATDPGPKKHDEVTG